MNGNSLSRIAYGTINISRFVQDAPGIFNGALQCSGAGVPIIGIAQEFTNAIMGTQYAPAQGYPACASGDSLRLYEQYDMNCMIYVGSGFNVLPGNLLVSDASGNAVPINLAASSTQWIGAKAIEGGTAGTLIRCSTYTVPYTHA